MGERRFFFKDEKRGSSASHPRRYVGRTLSIPTEVWSYIF